MLQIETTHEGPIVTLRLGGDIDERGVTDLRVALVKCLREKRYHMVLNMDGVRFISYMGVGVLVERLRQFRSEGGDMKLVGLNLYTERLFRMVGVTNLFETYENEDQALQVYEEAA